jgi:hypothetical protein
MFLRVLQTFKVRNFHSRCLNIELRCLKTSLANVGVITSAFFILIKFAVNFSQHPQRTIDFILTRTTIIAFHTFYVRK